LTDTIQPEDLHLRITTDTRDGQTQLRYILQSPSGAARFLYLEIAGPRFAGSPEDYYIRLLQKLEELEGGYDVDKSLLLQEDIESKLTKLGRELYRTLFPKELQQAYRLFREIVKTILIISDEPWIPWEMIRPYDDSGPEVIDDEFLCIRFQVTRWLSGDSGPAAEIEVPKLACVLVSADLPQARAEHDRVVALAGSRPEIQNISPEAPSVEIVEKLLQEGGIGLLHFVGHGDFDRAQPNESGIPMSDGLALRPIDLQGPILTRLKKDRPFVFLNACRVGQQSWALTGLGGWAERWVRAGQCGAFIGPLWSVRDSSAFDFAKTFYDALERGETFGQAAQTARMEVRKNHPGDPTWLAYTVYAHGNGRLRLSGLPPRPERTQASPEILRRILDFTPLIARKTEGFVGRQWLFDAVDGFLQKNTSGYVLILGDPGIGKTSVVAELVRRSRYPHHFNVRSEGLQKPEQFLPNVCAQLIRDFDLGYSSLPPETSRDSQFLKVLLERATAKLQTKGQKLLLLVDALDEADPAAVSRGANTLYLPSDLPPGVFVAVTSRRGAYKLQYACASHLIDLEKESENNFADVRLFTQSYLSHDGIRAYIAAQKLDEPSFVDEIVKRSEGNFMYLHYVLPEIERGAYATRDSIPLGLQSYYEDHWARMKELDTQGWYDYKLPVLVALTVAKEPISTNLIADFSGVKDRTRIQEALEEWSQFLQPIEAQDDDGQAQKRYRLYHESFHDFVGAKDQVKEKGVDLKGVHKQVADALWESLYPEG
jgi:hypothetical protein